MARFSKIILTLILFYSCTPHDDPPIIGIKVYNPGNNYEDLISEWDELGINTVFAGIDLYSNRKFRELCRINELQSFIIFPVFFDPPALEKDASLYAITDKGEKAIQEWVQFVCPSKAEFRAAKIDYATKLVKELKPDGISIDFIRHFAYWEKIHDEASQRDLTNTCFDQDCMMQFQYDHNINFPDSANNPMDWAAWILRHHRKTWIKWKCNLITSMVVELHEKLLEINPELMINIHTVPWRHNDFRGAIKSVIGQDISSLAQYVDFLSPMTYSHMLKQPPSWIHDVVLDMENETKFSILPSIQVANAYLEKPMSPSDFENALSFALKPPSKGVILWSWEHLAQSEEKKQVFQSMINKQIK
jgi:hypothetical protein